MWHCGWNAADPTTSDTPWYGQDNFFLTVPEKANGLHRLWLALGLFAYFNAKRWLAPFFPDAT
jgi:hypothetical protein